MSDLKFEREFTINITSPQGVKIEITQPLTAIINVKRSVNASVNSATVTLYNLAPNTRNAIYKDKYAYTLYWEMSITAGYKYASTYEIFSGNIMEAYSYKDGCDWITKITGYDGSYQIQNGFVNETINGGATIKSMVKKCLAAMPEIATGVLGGNSEETAVRGKTLVGSPYDNIQELTNNAAFIDGQELNILGENEVIGGYAFELNADNLFSTPRRRDTYLDCETLFSPEIRVGCKCTLSSSDARFDGLYSVLGIKHAVTISGASAGDATSTVSLNAGSGTFTEVF